MYPSILIVDDEPSILQSLSGLLSDEGFEISTAANGYEALKIVDTESPDLVLLDIWMPGIDGIETLKRIKEKRPDLEIIMLTGHATVKSGIEAMKFGAEDFLEKPVDLNELLEKIGEAKNKRMLVVEKGHQDEVRKIIKSKTW